MVRFFETRRINSVIRRVSKNRTILMVEHNLSVVASLSNRITVLARGQVLAEGDYATRLEGSARHRSLYRGRSWLRRPAPPATAPLLAVRDLDGWYGESHVLHGIDFDVQRRRGRHAARP